MSNACSATSFLSREFCFWSSCNCLAIFGFMPPYFFRQMCYACWLIPSRWQTSGTFMPSQDQRLPAEAGVRSAVH
jgi:hypothetical protein